MVTTQINGNSIKGKIPTNIVQEHIALWMKNSSVDEKWPVEPIPDTDTLFCYVHSSSAIKKKKINLSPKAFRNTPFKGGTDLSSDWNKYSTAEETRERIGKQKKGNGEFKKSTDYYVVSFLVSDILKTIPNQQVIHDPIQDEPNQPDNRSHTQIFGDKDEEVRLKMVDMAKWEIAPDED